MRSQPKPDSGICRRLGCLASLALLLVIAALPPQARAQGNTATEDESLIAPIRLAARGGDVDLARERLDSLEKPRLVAMGTAALGYELSLAGDDGEAESLFDEAVEIATNGNMLSLERVQTYLFVARLLAESEGYEDRAQDLLDIASSATGRLAGVNLDLALTELVATVLRVSGDRQQAYDLLQLLSNDRVRAKLVKSYGLSDLEG